MPHRLRMEEGYVLKVGGGKNKEPGPSLSVPTRALQRLSKYLLTLL